MITSWLPTPWQHWRAKRRQGTYPRLPDLASLPRPNQDLSRADKFEYAKEVSLASGGMGLGVAFVLFTVNLMATFILACRCNRLLKADLAIANLEDDGDVGECAQDYREHGRGGGPGAEARRGKSRRS